MSEQSTSSAEHDQILARIAQVQRALDAHIREAHAELIERSEIERMLRTAVAPMNENARRLDMLVDLWKGSIDRLTGERREHEGLEWRFAKLEEDLGSFIAQAHSEGLPAKVVNPAVTKQDRTAIWVAAISGVMTTLGAIVVAYLQFVASP